MTKLIICDIDDTLTKPTEDQKKLNLSVFFRPDVVSELESRKIIIDWVKFLYNSGYALYFVTGRPIELYNATKIWLRKEGFTDFKLYCREKRYAISENTKSKINNVEKILDKYEDTVSEIIFIDNNKYTVKEYLKTFSKNIDKCVGYHIKRTSKTRMVVSNTKV